MVFHQNVYPLCEINVYSGDAFCITVTFVSVRVYKYTEAINIVC